MRRKLRKQRPEAFWGAVIGAGASILGSLIGGKSQADSAQAQADAIIQASKENAKALEEQNRNNNILQKQSMDFIANQNAQARQLQMDMQTSMQLQGGYDSMSARRRDNRIVVKKGGKVSRKKLRDISFYGGGNLPFRVTDGGGVLALGQTPEGYDLYEIIGNDHDHYHKTRGGKYKTGVGIEFAGDTSDVRDIQAKGGPSSRVVEGEGNQNTNQGEYLLVTPNEGMFISKHSINGFNPVQAINQGMHPLDAYNIQEASKGSSPVRRNRHKATAGILVNGVLPLNYPTYNIDDMVRRQLRKGGRCKAPLGAFVGPQPYGYYTPTAYAPFVDSWYGTTLNPQLTNSSGVNTSGRWGSLRSYFNNNPSYNNRRSRLSGNIIGAGITGVGNLLGAGISNIFTNRAASVASGAELERARILGDAYRNLQTVDMSMLDGENGKLMFDRGSYLPVTESTKVYDNTQREAARRLGREALSAAKRGSLSSSAMLSRMAGINAGVQEQLSRISDATSNQEAENRRANMAAINEAGARNLQLTIDALRDRTAARLDLLKYNNDIVNQRITAPAEAQADALANAAGIRANARNAIGQGWASAIAGTGQAFGNAFATDAKQHTDIEMARLSASRSGELSYLRRFGSSDEINREVARLESIINNPNTSADFKQQAIRDRDYLIGSWT